MLSDRISLITAYLQGVQSGTLKRDHESLRQISSLVASLPASSELPEFQTEFLTEYNDVLLTSYLANMTSGLNSLNEVSWLRSNEVCTDRSTTLKLAFCSSSTNSILLSRGPTNPSVVSEVGELEETVRVAFSISRWTRVLVSLPLPLMSFTSSSTFTHQS